MDPFNYFNVSSSARHGQPPGQPGQPNNQDYWQNPFQAMGMGMGMMGMGGWNNMEMGMGNSMQMPQIASGFNFTPMPKLELPNMNAQCAPAQQTTVRPTPSAAAGSQQQLDEAVVASAAAMPVKKVEKRERNEEDDDTKKATSSFESYLAKIEAKRLSKQASKPDKKAMVSEAEDSGLEAADSSDEDFVKKTKVKRKPGRPSERKNEGLLKGELQELAKQNRKTIIRLQKEEKSLIKDNQDLKMMLKKQTQHA